MKRDSESNQLPSRIELVGLSVFGATPEECEAAALLLSQLYPEPASDENLASWEMLRWQEQHADEIRKSEAGREIEEWIAELPEESIDDIGPLEPTGGVISDRPAPPDTPRAPAPPQSGSEPEGESMRKLRGEQLDRPEIVRPLQRINPEPPPPEPIY